MSKLNVTQVDGDGVTTNLVAADSEATGEDTFSNNGKTFIEVANSGGVDETITVVAQKKCDAGFLHNKEIVVTAGATEKIGPFSPQWFNDGQGEVHLTYSDPTNLTLAAFSL